MKENSRQSVTCSVSSTSSNRSTVKLPDRRHTTVPCIRNSRRGHRLEAARVVERARHQRDGLRREPPAQRLRGGRADRVGVRPHRAFGQAGRARGVEQRHRVRIGHLRRVGQRFAAEQHLERKRPIRDRIGGIRTDHEGLDPGLRAHRLDPVEQAAVHDHRFAARIGEDELQLGGREPEVEPDRDDAEPHRGEAQRHVLGVVEQHQAEPVALAEAEFAQRRRVAQRFVPQLRVGQPVAAVEADRDPVAAGRRELVGHRVEQSGERHGLPSCLIRPVRRRSASVR